MIICHYFPFFLSIKSNNAVETVFSDEIVEALDRFCIDQTDQQLRRSREVEILVVDWICKFMFKDI